MISYAIKGNPVGEMRPRNSIAGKLLRPSFLSFTLPCCSHWENCKWRVVGHWKSEECVWDENEKSNLVVFLQKIALPIWQSNTIWTQQVLSEPKKWKNPLKLEFASVPSFLIFFAGLLSMSFAHTAISSATVSRFDPWNESLDPPDPTLECCHSRSLVIFIFSASKSSDSQSLIPPIPSMSSPPSEADEATQSQKDRCSLETATATTASLSDGDNYSDSSESEGDDAPSPPPTKRGPGRPKKVDRHEEEPLHR